MAKAENRKALLWQLCLSALLVAGALLALAAPWGALSVSALWAIAAGMLVWCAAAAARRLGHPWAVWLLRLAPWAALLVLAGPGQIVEGLRLWINCVLTNWNRLHQGALPLFQTGAPGGGGEFAISLLAAVALGQLAEWIVSRQRVLACAVVNAALLLVQLLGGFFAPWACGLFFSALLGLWMSGPLPARQTVRAWALCTLALCLCAGCFRGGELKGVTLFRKTLLEEVHTLRYGKDLLPQGKLRQAAKLNRGEEELLQVRTEQEKALYLRGFVGAAYQNGVWTPLPDSAYGGEYAGMLDWLAEQGFDSLTQSAAYYALCGQENSPQINHVQVEVTGASRYYIYAPASLTEMTNATAEKDSRLRSSGLWGAKAYHLEECSSVKPSELTIRADWVAEPETEEQQRYTRAEAVYRDFVYQNYTAVNADLAPLMRELFPQEDAGTGVYSALEQIRNVLRHTTQFVLEPEGSTDDPIRDFLTGERKGNAALYASTAVEALRSLGYPARYVEGYYVPVSAVGEDGSATLTGQNAHAWAEVYFDGVGWLPVDVTPGYYYDAVLLQQMVALPDTARKTAAVEEGDNGANEMTTDADSGARPSLAPELIVRDAALALLGLLAVCVLLATVIFLVLELLRLALEHRAHTVYDAAGEQERAFILKDRVFFLLSLWGVDACLGWECGKTDAEIAEKVPGVEPGEYSRVSALLEKAIYGGLALEPFEQRTVLTLLQKLYSGEPSRRERLHWALRYNRLLALRRRAGTAPEKQAA